MSESENGSDWEIGEDGNPVRKREKKIKIEVSRDAEIDSLQEELAKTKIERAEGDKEAIDSAKTQVILDLFEREKELQSQIHPDLKDQILNAKTPQEMESVISGYRPSGKASIGEGSTYQIMQDIQNANKFDNPQQLLDSIYTVLNNVSGKYSQQEKQFALEQRNRLWKSLLEGNQLKEMKRRNQTVYAKTMLTYCPSCQRKENGGILVTMDLNKTDTCPRCGQRIIDRGR